MNVHWHETHEPFPIVEFHDVRTEKSSVDRYLGIAAGQTPTIRTFRVTGQTDRIVSLRGFASMEARRQALTAVQGGPGWAAQRRELADLTRSADVLLMRAITPAGGLPAASPESGYQVLASELRFPEQIGNFHLWLRLLLRKSGLDPVAAFATLEAANDVPAVPVIKNRTHHIALIGHGSVPELPRELRGMLRYRPETLVLEPAVSLVW